MQPSGLGTGKHVPYIVSYHCSTFSYRSLVLLPLHHKQNQKSVSVAHLALSFKRIYRIKTLPISWVFMLKNSVQISPFK